MRKVLILAGFLIFLAGCYKRWTEVSVFVCAPNWTSDNKVVFVKEVIVWEITKIPPFIAERADVKSDEFWLYEINHDGTGLREICYLWDRPGGIGGLSSAGDWIVFSDNIYQEIYIIKRDGTGLKKVGYGVNPDFSPDAEKIVYEKPNQGIWIMDRDGGNDHCIVADSCAKYPAWSPDDTLIAYGYYGLRILKTDGIVIKEYERVGIPDWGPKGSNKIIVEAYHGPLIIDIKTDSVDSMESIITGNRAKWSPLGEYFIAYDGDWFVIKSDGSQKWYIKEKIEGGE